VSKKPISWSWANCVAYSSSGGTANFDITLLMRRLQKIIQREKLQEIILSWTAGLISPLTEQTMY
jgi:hypothetical protein